MALDLTLLPFDHDHEDFAYSHTVLYCTPDRDLLSVILELEHQRGERVPRDFNSYLSREGDYSESHYGLTLTTAYGDSLLCVYAGRLVKFKSLPGVMQEPKNRAVWAYLAALPEDTRVALYWR